MALIEPTPAIVRRSNDADVPPVAEIYSHYVRTALATFEIDPPNVEEVARRRVDVLERGLPYLVAEMDGVIAAYAYASPYRPRPAYRFSVEDSIYVHPAYGRKGIGRLLLRALIESCETAGCKQMIAIIGDTDNAASIGLHEALGFRHVGILENVGFKFGRWIDTVLMQRPLGAGETITKR
jgi:phosphinothricin acetyltransferase